MKRLIDEEVVGVASGRDYNLSMFAKIVSKRKKKREISKCLEGKLEFKFFSTQSLKSF